ncbi:MAG: DUF2793 domain-containing protein, partial [Bosea sp. (in: a-proteobacteria)]
TGAFAGRSNQIALFEDGGWTFLAPRKGWQCWIEDEAELHVWTGSQWRRASPISSLGASLWGVNATADATTRLAVSAAASLFNHAGAGHQLKLNKAGAGDTASLLMQTGWSGRAEIGLSGDDDLHIKVSADGGAWREALVIERSTGRVSLPATPWAQERAQPNLLINGDMQIDQRGFAGGALAAGAYGFDRWKAGAAGATLSRSGFEIVLSAGAIVQIVEPSLWGLTSFAGMPLTLSVEALTGAALEIALGGSSARLQPGQGLASVTLTPDAGESGALPLRLAAVAGTARFQRVKLELGQQATGRCLRSAVEEERLCRRYHWRRGAPGADAAGAHAHNAERQFRRVPAAQSPGCSDHHGTVCRERRGGGHRGCDRAGAGGTDGGGVRQRDLSRCGDRTTR